MTIGRFHRRLLATINRSITAQCCRPSSSTALQWPNEDKVLALDDIKRIERHWSDRVTTRPGHGLPTPSTSSTPAKSAYILSMFPYPSGQLHMGHVRVYTICDVLARYHARQGFHVLQPIGWDAFGLPAENAAKEHKMNPAVWTAQNIDVMREQLLRLGASFDWDTELYTCRSDYYRWTQWLFLQLFDAGLVHRRSAFVNYDPVDETVLADEQIDADGRSWRSGAVVERRLLRQWMIRTNRFAEAMYDNLTKMKGWRDVAQIQKEFLGEPKYHAFYLPLVDRHMPDQPLDDDIMLLIKDAQQLHHAELIVVDRNHALYKMCEKRHPEMKDDNQMHILPQMAINPLNGRRLPIVLLAARDCKDWFPAHTDEGFVIRDASNDRLDAYLVMVMKHTAIDGQGDKLDARLMRLDDSDEKMLVALDDGRGLMSHEDICKEALVSVKVSAAIFRNSNLQTNTYGGYKTSSRLRDWCVSRQRYWGTPIPIVHCPCCGVVPVAEADLPVKLPDVEHIPKSANAASPLASIEEWVTVACPECQGEARRETDTLDTFFDSAWYFMRYLDPKNDKEAFDSEKVNAMMPVSVYVGGKEHATLHLYYARFITHFLKSIGKLSACDEPFDRLLPQGIVKSRTFVNQSTGRFVPADQVEGSDDDSLTDATTGDRVTLEWHKMSKSKHNGVDPVAVLDEYGADVTRALIVSKASPYSDRNWDEQEWKGVTNWLSRVRYVVNEFVRQSENKTDVDAVELEKMERTTRDARNKFIRMISYNYHNTHLLSVAITKMQGLTSALRKCPPHLVAHSIEHRLALKSLIIAMSPITPHISAELWAAIQTAKGVDEGDVWDQSWPTADEESARDLVLFIDGTRAGSITMPNAQLKQLTVDDALDLALKEKRMKSMIGGQKIGEKSLEFVEFLGAELRISAEGKTVFKKEKKL